MWHVINNINKLNNKITSVKENIDRSDIKAQTGHSNTVNWLSYQVQKINRRYLFEAIEADRRQHDLNYINEFMIPFNISFCSWNLNMRKRKFLK